ncbi:MAG TPA: hypothetical protein VKA26_04435 [Ignavibacteriaceae bacterium]|nr:hypothetical protein [Ignavibacteriaceae bacterium]
MPTKVPENSVHYLEIVTPDVESVCNLYTKSYGWEFQAIPELGNAQVAEFPDGSLCGIRAPMSEMEKPIVRTYLRVGDLETSVKKAAESGANILLGKMELPRRGIIAIYEIGGIEHGIWQL